MESVGAGDGVEAGGGVRLGAVSPPGCYRAWPPPLRPTDVAGPSCAGCVCITGRRSSAPATARVSVPLRPLSPRKSAWRTRPRWAFGASPRAVRPLALTHTLNLSSLRLFSSSGSAQPAGSLDRPSRPWFRM